jgi:molybdopterin synthase sulfur carrier subunit
VKTTVKLFAAARQLAGQEVVEVSVPSPGRIADLRQALSRQFPSLQPLLKHALFAIDAEYADNETRIPDGAEVACIPPVSGG